MSNISSKIMNLKFMQRHKNQVEQQQKAAAEATKRLEAEWSLEQAAGPSGPAAAQQPARAAPDTNVAAAAAAAAAAPTPTPRDPTLPARRVIAVDDVSMTEQQQLLQFRPGRRSFGSFNPRLEKRLTEIDQHKRDAAELIESERRAAEERQKKAAQHAELLRKAEAQEEVERQNEVSEAEMAARYAKYLPSGLNNQQPTSMPEPPVVSNPVRVRDAPATSGGGGGKKRKMNPL